MKNHLLRPWSILRVLAFCILHFAFCILCSCSRPQTAAEMFDKMPRRYGGELRLQGETGTRTLKVELLDLKVRDEHMLEFNRIAYEVSGGNEGVQKGEAPVTGTVTAPGGQIYVEDASKLGGGDALKQGSFEGRLSRDLEKVDAKWKTGFDQTVSFQGKAAR